MVNYYETSSFFKNVTLNGTNGIESNGFNLTNGTFITYETRLYDQLKVFKNETFSELFSEAEELFDYVEYDLEIFNFTDIIRDVYMKIEKDFDYFKDRLQVNFILHFYIF